LKTRNLFSKGAGKTSAEQQKTETLIVRRKRTLFSAFFFLRKHAPSKGLSERCVSKQSETSEGRRKRCEPNHIWESAFAFKRKSTQGKKPQS